MWHKCHVTKDIYYSTNLRSKKCVWADNEVVICMKNNGIIQFGDNRADESLTTTIKWGIKMVCLTKKMTLNDILFRRKSNSWKIREFRCQISVLWGKNRLKGLKRRSRGYEECHFITRSVRPHVSQDKSFFFRVVSLLTLPLRFANLSDWLCPKLEK